MSQNLMFGVLFGVILGVLVGMLNFPVVTYIFDTIDMQIQTSIGLTMRSLLNETIVLIGIGAAAGFFGGMMLGTGRTAT